MIEIFARLRIVTKQGGGVIPRPSGQSLGVHGVGTKQSKSWCPWSWNQATKILVSMDLEPCNFFLTDAIDLKFNVDNAPCKLDGGRELNNTI